MTASSGRYPGYRCVPHVSRVCSTASRVGLTAPSRPHACTGIVDRPGPSTAPGRRCLPIAA